jgi:hypothetical protein
VTGEPDRGEADPELAAALEAWDRGDITEAAMLAVLRDARLLIPIVAVAADNTEKLTDMALPKLVGSDGRHAVMAFSSVDAMKRWDPQARPVPVQAPRGCEAATGEGCALVVDVGGPVQVVLEGARLAAMATGEQIPSPEEDPDVRSVIQAIVDSDPDASSFTLAPSDAGDLLVMVKAADPSSAARVARAIAVALRYRFRALEFRAEP